MTLKREAGTEHGKWNHNVRENDRGMEARLEPAGLRSRIESETRASREYKIVRLAVR